MPSWYDDPNSNTNEQWAPEYTGGAGLSEATRRYLQWRNQQAGPSMPEWEAGQPFKDYAKTTMNSDWAQPENFMWANVLGPVRTTGQSPYKMIEYWSKGKPEPPIGHGTSKLQYTEPMTNPMGQTKPARFDYVEIGPSNIKANRELFEELERNLGTKELDRMQLTEMLPGAVPFWERWATSQHSEHLPTLRKNMTEMAQQTRQKFGSQIPERGYGYARKKGEVPSPGMPHFGETLDDPNGLVSALPNWYAPPSAPQDPIRLWGSRPDMHNRTAIWPSEIEWRLSQLKAGVKPETIGEMQSRASAGGRFSEPLTQTWINEANLEDYQGTLARRLTNYLRQLASE